MGVEGVADRLAEEVEREHREDEDEPGQQEVPPGRVEERRCLGDHLSPARLWWIDPDAEDEAASIRMFSGMTSVI